MDLSHIDEQDLARLWKVKPSDVDGYHRSYTTETEDGDLLQVDYNYPRQMVRISIKLDREAMREYVAVIKSGSILQEREVIGRRTLDLSHKLAPLLPYFTMLPDASLLQSLGGLYGIPEVSPLQRHSNSPALPIYPERQKFSFIKIFREYLEKKRSREQTKIGFFNRLLHRLPAELLDISLGLVLLWSFMAGFLNLTELAGYAGSLGLLCGAWDWVWRQRDPFMPKIIALMAISGWAVYWQVQNRMWAVFL